MWKVLLSLTEMIFMYKDVHQYDLIFVWRIHWDRRSLTPDHGLCYRNVWSSSMLQDTPHNELLKYVNCNEGVEHIHSQYKPTVFVGITSFKVEDCLTPLFQQHADIASHCSLWALTIQITALNTLSTQAHYGWTRTSIPLFIFLIFSTEIT